LAKIDRRTDRAGTHSHQPSIGSKTGHNLRIVKRGANMRKFILFVLACAMLCGGLYLTVNQLLFSGIVSTRFVIGGIMLASMGAWLLWVDFVAPALNIRTSED
jgi:hypothetical protein